MFYFAFYIISHASATLLAQGSRKTDATLDDGSHVDSK